MSSETIGPDHWQLSLYRFDFAQVPVPEFEDYRLSSTDELDRVLDRFADESHLAIGLDELDEDDCHWGSFWVFLTHLRAWIHLMEGPCLTARDPTLSDSSIEEEFLIDNGDSKQVPYRDTLSREQGLGALRVWMSEGKKLDELTWERL
jgi:hypothetical protein